jgi:hypothetical protein
VTVRGLVNRPAPPRPATKDDCKHGGRRRFDFKNQGQCVAAVNHRPKPPPA